MVISSCYPFANPFAMSSSFVFHPVLLLLPAQPQKDTFIWEKRNLTQATTARLVACLLRYLGSFRFFYPANQPTQQARLRIGITAASEVVCPSGLSNCTDKTGHRMLGERVPK
ncbi:hypothetical protein HRR83_001935 [Exophiala dermatitidis]|nr:hypothetical protein HRR73_005443 [Exophiala dermatitidis]KAJ4523819.1 hypothetical protein HRR74_002012 [Exophiala dermatitidis]KAJ4537242.1 hypothetical protein HRR76_005256 [Exophiala dermatitidis]KAJ4555160.1 hypothetical protein HRR77_001100 [Exophiala dermatitidis]KAJ4566342.1 hypothetical protein HRR79_005350 [Exophiala dermatitidis]